MKILISGSNGLVGSALGPALSQQAHSVTQLVRSKVQSGIHWNPEGGLISSTPFEGFDAVIHLAGESIASGRWSEEKKKTIRDSRVKGTRLLTDILTRLKQPPQTYLVASAIGYYGNRGTEGVNEESRIGTGFLAEVCRDWEVATVPASQKGIRVVNLRFGMILSPRGGALKKMLLPFKFGVGGKIGTGRQIMSWVALDDVVSAILHILKTDSIRGPVNVVAPHSVTNQEFTTTLGRVLNRPTFLPMPAIAAKLAFGQMADELLLTSQKVEPMVLSRNNFNFRYPNLDVALRHLLRK
jgi:uncharacterized protein (TIGR01777 family)